MGLMARRVSVRGVNVPELIAWGTNVPGISVLIHKAEYNAQVNMLKIVYCKKITDRILFCDVYAGFFKPLLMSHSERCF